MEVCRACGEVPNEQNQLSEHLQKYSDIYYNLTSIKLLPEEDLDRQRICDECHLKLLEYNRFRTVCLQVHYRLTEIKIEDHDGTEVVPLECKPNVAALKIEQLDFSDTEITLDDVLDRDVTDVSEVSDDDKPIAMRRKKKIKVAKGASTKDLIYSCNRCSKKFRSETRFQGHLRTHDGLKPALCKLCGKSFAKYNSLKLHLIQKHSENKQKFPCDFPSCELVYSTKQSMQAHRRKHDPNFIMPQPKRAVCDQCGKTFSTAGALKKHNYIHTGDMPFQCNICNKKLPTAHKLKEHTMRHEGVKNHVCPYCGMKKTTRHELKVHMNYHTREKQFTCHVCAQIFTNIGNMSRHIRIVHCGIKKYTCTYCDRSFGKAETLKHHVMTHTGEKPHECKVCGRRFIQSVALQTHMKTHRKQQAATSTQIPTVQPQMPQQLNLSQHLNHHNSMMHSPQQTPMVNDPQTHLQ